MAWCLCSCQLATDLKCAIISDSSLSFHAGWLTGVKSYVKPWYISLMKYSQLLPSQRGWMDSPRMYWSRTLSNMTSGRGCRRLRKENSSLAGLSPSLSKSIRSSRGQKGRPFLSHKHQLEALNRPYTCSMRKTTVNDFRHLFRIILIKYRPEQDEHCGRIVDYTWRSKLLYAPSKLTLNRWEKMVWNLTFILSYD